MILHGKNCVHSAIVIVVAVVCCWLRSTRRRLAIIQTALIVCLTNCIMDDLITIKMIIIGDYSVHSVSAIVRFSPVASVNWLHFNCSWHVDAERIFRMQAGNHTMEQQFSAEFSPNSFGADVEGKNFVHMPSITAKLGTLEVGWIHFHFALPTKLVNYDVEYQ